MQHHGVVEPNARQSKEGTATMTKQDERRATHRGMAKKGKGQQRRTNAPGSHRQRGVKPTKVGREIRNGTGAPRKQLPPRKKVPQTPASAMQTSRADDA